MYTLCIYRHGALGHCAIQTAASPAEPLHRRTRALGKPRLARASDVASVVTSSPIAKCGHSFDPGYCSTPNDSIPKYVDAELTMVHSDVAVCVSVEWYRPSPDSDNYRCMRVAVTLHPHGLQGLLWMQGLLLALTGGLLRDGRPSSMPGCLAWACCSTCIGEGVCTCVSVQPPRRASGRCRYVTRFRPFTSRPIRGGGGSKSLTGPVRNPRGVYSTQSGVFEATRHALKLKEAPETATSLTLTAWVCAKGRCVHERTCYT